jgi:hypothetical protein
MDLRDYYLMQANTISENDLKLAASVMATHVGKANAISKPELTRALFGKTTDSTERKAREILKRLVTECGIAIGSNSGSSGYYICETEAEKSECIAELKSRARELNERAYSLFSVSLPSSTTINRLQGGLF